MSDLVELHEIVKHYGDVQALNGVSLSIKPGVTGLLGPNGAGKSTLIKVILGLVRVTSGGGTVLGFRVGYEDRLIRDAVGFMPEDDCYIAGLSGVEAVQFVSRLNGKPAIASLRRAHEILDFCGSGQERYRNVETYSTGMRQKLKFAQALVHDPDFLILDEPTSGLDPDEREIMLARIRTLSTQYGKTVVISTHILPDVQAICDDVIIMAKGQVQLMDSLENISRPVEPLMRLRIVGNEEAFCEAIRERKAKSTVERGGAIAVTPSEDFSVGDLWQLATDQGVTIRSIEPAKTSLDEVFVRAVRESQNADS